VLFPLTSADVFALTLGDGHRGVTGDDQSVMFIAG